MANIGGKTATMRFGTRSTASNRNIGPNVRKPLGLSRRQNQVANVTNASSGATKPSVNNFKTSRIPVVNDENREVFGKKNENNSSSCRSQIPIDISKKNQLIVTEKVKPKTKEIAQIKEELGYSSNLIPDNVENIDANDGHNVFLTPDYVNDIYSYLRYLEEEQCIRPNFLSIQREMTPRMRSVLIDWLINVHHQFKLLPETLYLGIAIMDRFFQKEVISKDKIQLVGVTAFFIASKFEEIYPPDIKDFVMICDKLYHKRDIIKMELSVLKSLKFELGRPLPLHFLRRNSKAAHADSRIHALAKYLMELTLVEYECAHWKPSFLAAVSLYVTLKILADSEDSSLKWTPTLEFYSNYKEQQLLSSASLVCKIIQKAEKSKFQNCRKKYSSAKLLEISKIPHLKSSVVDQMAALQP